ncbi:hypothetical protein BDQ17DRAFT_1327204 [Cyathus striatus]|nr:hypothetical protein BDQ17DRAFT_1327204 [Cyathus striatus]
MWLAATEPFPPSPLLHHYQSQTNPQTGPLRNPERKGKRGKERKEQCPRHRQWISTRPAATRLPASLLAPPTAQAARHVHPPTRAGGNRAPTPTPPLPLPRIANNPPAADDNVCPPTMGVNARPAATRVNARPAAAGISAHPPATNNNACPYTTRQATVLAPLPILLPPLLLLPNDPPPPSTIPSPPLIRLLQPPLPLTTVPMLRASGPCQRVRQHMLAMRMNQ